MSNLNRERLMAETKESHPLDHWVNSSIKRLDRLFSHQERTNTIEDGRELLAWWKEAQKLLNMHITENPIAHRLRAAFVQRSLEPLFEAHLTEHQYERLTNAFELHFKEILELSNRFINGPGTMTANSVVAKELKAAQDEMRRLHFWLYSSNSARKTR